ncbi:hypothetical protein TK50_12890 [Micromonospora haikouensis]|uniref:HTH tetR-type domain-containing protein n=1 Tax=Micromonospora haikouensis TaxID=686309 RepID=A0A0D0V7X3_9ACTN|nr:hypothetical protein TK50_12890 [Micromonospora haikouensis]
MGEVGPRRRPGGRAAAVVAAVRRAAVELLEEVGYEGLVLTDVASRAGVNKTTVYRRWPTRVQLVSDILLAQAAEQVGTPDTGDLVGDLCVLLADVAALLRTRAARAVLAALVAGESDPAVAVARDAFWAERFGRSAVIVERAVRRGELPPGTDARLLLEEASSPVYFRLMFTGEPVGPADIELFARRAAETARARPSSRR